MKKTACRPSFPFPLGGLMSRQKSILGETGIPSSRWNSDMTHQVTRDHVPSSVSWNSANVQQNVVGNLSMLEPVFCSLLNYARAKLNQRRCSLKCVPQFWTDRFAMNNTISFSFFLVMVAHQLHTMFEILNSKVCPLKFSLTRMSVQVLSSLGKKDSEGSSTRFD